MSGSRATEKMAALAEDHAIEVANSRASRILEIMDDLDGSGKSSSHKDVFEVYRQRFTEDTVSFKQWKKTSTKARKQRLSKKTKTKTKNEKENEEKIDHSCLKEWRGTGVRSVSKVFENMVSEVWERGCRPLRYHNSRLECSTGRLEADLRMRGSRGWTNQAVKVLRQL